MSVATRLRTRIRFPDKRSRDPRFSVTIEEPTTPFPVTVYFVRITDDAVDASAWINVGLEMGHRYEANAVGEPVLFERLPPRLDRAAVQEVTDRFGEYVEYARAELGLVHRPTDRPRRMGRRRQWTDDFLSLIAEQYDEWSREGRRAVTEISNAHGVNRSTASRWVDAARDRGFLPPKEEKP